MKLRQVALAARDLGPVRREILDLLGVTSDFSDPGVGEFGLENSVMAIGDTFLEVVSPLREDTAAGRWIDRRGGDGGYMALFQVDELASHHERVERLGVRKVWNIERDEVEAFHIHPRDIGGAIVSIDCMNPAEEWLWAGPGWRQRRAARVASISAIDVEASDPEALGTRWGQVLGQPVGESGDAWTMELEVGTVNFVASPAGNREGICAIEFETDDGTLAGTETEVCGTRFRFVRS